MRIGSLFSGAGGLDLAVAEVFGGEIVWHAEIAAPASENHSARTETICDCMKFTAATR